MADPLTGISRGFGFVRFSLEDDCKRALVEMQGVVITPSTGVSPGRPLRVCTATPKTRGSTSPTASNTALLSDLQLGEGAAAIATDPNNTTVFVGGLSSLISEETLKTFFIPFGEITYTKIPPGKGCGFVQFVYKADAERALERMQGFPIGGGRIRLSWGRS
ncbi:RNA-binding domain-containing protein, partial [Tilletiopsis washingtonensis]